MPSLADTQIRLRSALVEGDASAIAPMLVGGRDPLKRLGIHVRHYETSLVEALTRRFPALVWLVGRAPVDAAAREFVHRHPPTAPCIAEYGEEFPAFLAERVGRPRALSRVVGATGVASRTTSPWRSSGRLLMMGSFAEIEAGALPELHRRSAARRALPRCAVAGRRSHAVVHGRNRSGGVRLRTRHTSWLEIRGARGRIPDQSARRGNFRVPERDLCRRIDRRRRGAAHSRSTRPLIPAGRSTQCWSMTVSSRRSRDHGSRAP